MTVPTYNVYANQPRLFFRDTEKTTLQTRIANAAGWKDIWDDTIIPRANNLAGRTDASFGTASKPDAWVMTLALAGYLLDQTRTTGGYIDKAITGALYSVENGDTGADEDRRRLAAGSIAFDILQDFMTAGEKSDLSDGCETLANTMANESSEVMTGHSGLEQMLQIMAGLSFYDYAAWGATSLTEGLEFWYGDDVALGSGGTADGRLETYRHFFSDGGTHEGGHYTFRNVMWEITWLFECLTNGTDLDLWASESNNAKVWEGLMWLFRGDDIEVHGDSTKITDPFFIDHYRFGLSHFSEQFPEPNSTEGGRHLRWIWEQMDALDSPNGEEYIYDVLAMDIANNTAIAPSSATTEPATARLFDPPGFFYLTKNQSANPDWSYSAAARFRVSGRKHYIMEHTHRDIGSMYIGLGSEPLLLSPSGNYPGTIVEALPYRHNVNWNQRTVGQSLAPLIQAGQTYTHFSTALADDGGQQYKKYLASAGSSSRPWSIDFMLNEDSGNAWLACDEFAMLVNNAFVTFLKCDMKTSYRRYHDDTLIAPICETKYLFIHPSVANTLNYPAVLVYIRIQKATAGNTVHIPFHHRGNPVATSYGWTADGYDGNGRLYVDVDNKANYTITEVNKGTDIGDGYGDTQFQYPGGGTNYDPTKSYNSREAPDVKEHSMFVSLTTPTEYEDYVFLLMPDYISAGEPVSGRTWVTDANYYGVNLGTEQFLIHKTTDTIGGTYGTDVDVTPPGEVTNLDATDDDNEQCEITWTDPTDSDLASCKIWYREKPAP